MKKIAFKKISPRFAGLIIVCFAVFTAALVGYMVFKTESAIARSGIGIKIVSVPLKCVLDPETNTCPNCLICGDNSACANVFEVKATFLSGINTMYKGSALCIMKPVPPKGGTFRAGAQCLGVVSGVYPNVLTNFGCSR